jgi:N4-gp56 family major capsid protein
MAKSSIKFWAPGQEHTPNRERHINQEVLDATAVTYDGVAKTFSGRAKGSVQPKHFGDTFSKRVSYGMSHPNNIISLEEGDLNIANIYTTVHAMIKVSNTVVEGKTKDVAVLIDGKPVRAKVSFEQAQSNAASSGKRVEEEMWALRTAAADQLKLDIAAALGAGKCTAEGSNEAVVVDNVTFRHSTGDLYGRQGSGSKHIGAMTSIPETGGTMNAVYSSSKLVSAKISFHGLHTEFSPINDNVGDIKTEAKERIQHLTNIRAESIEKQVEQSLLDVAKGNALVSSSGIESSIGEMNENCTISLKSLNAYELALSEAEVPKQTTTKSSGKGNDSSSVESGWFVYVHPHLTHQLERLTMELGTSNAMPVMQTPGQYVDRVKLQPNEIGKIGRFRFIEVPHMDIFKGEGCEITGNEGVGFRTSLNEDGNTAFDVYPMMVVGDDSFETSRFSHNNIKVAHVPPTRTQGHNGVGGDLYARTGALVTEWTYGFLAYKPERIRCLLVTSKTI